MEDRVANRKPSWWITPAADIAHWGAKAAEHLPRDPQAADAMLAFKRHSNGYTCHMKTISTSELRSKTRSLVRTLENGKPVELTHRGQRLASIFPVRQTNGIRADDPLYRFHRKATSKAKPLSDREMDQIMYGG